MCGAIDSFPFTLAPLEGPGGGSSDVNKHLHMIVCLKDLLSLSRHTNIINYMCKLKGPLSDSHFRTFQCNSNFNTYKKRTVRFMLKRNKRITAKTEAKTFYFTSISIFYKIQTHSHGESFPIVRVFTARSGMHYFLSIRQKTMRGMKKK